MGYTLFVELDPGLDPDDHSDKENIVLLLLEIFRQVGLYPAEWHYFADVDKAIGQWGLEDRTRGLTNSLNKKGFIRNDKPRGKLWFITEAGREYLVNELMIQLESVNPGDLFPIVAD